MSAARYLPLLILLCLMLPKRGGTWGFYAHRTINYYAVFLLPPELLKFYKENIDFISEHAVDPDKRRYAVAGEAEKHYIDLDRYGSFPYDSLPRHWNAAKEKYSEDTLRTHGIVPYWVPIMLQRLTDAFKNKDQYMILKNSAEIGHYIGDAHVPLHTTSNYNGGQTNQHGIHGFWESRVPELFAARDYDFFIGKASYIDNPSSFIWTTVLESNMAVDSVLKFEAKLNNEFPSDAKYSYEERLGTIIRQYSHDYSQQYQSMLNGMIERRMKQTILAVASFWYTAWINAGQPTLHDLKHKELTPEEIKEIEKMNELWKAGGAVKGKDIES